jgi:paraquat-inducible protein A
LVQRLPVVPAGMRACCGRCGTHLRRRRAGAGSNNGTVALALAALILYPLGVMLPMLTIERFGHHHEASILEGISTLISSGHLVVGIIVLLCSIVFPLGKLLALLVLSAGGMAMRHKHRALTYHIVEWTGRWGMLDVLLVALLVAALKIGDLVEVSAGPAAFAFTTVVVLSLLATALFDPHSLWPMPTAENENAND